MSTHSKLFHENFRGYSCKDVIHPDHTCWKWLWKLISYDLPVGSAKLYIPICLTSLAYNMHQWHKLETWTETFKMLVQCMKFSIGLTSSFFAVSCLQYHILKQYYYYLFVTVPLFCGSFFSFILPRPILKAEAIGLFDYYLEYLIRSCRIGWVRSSKKSLVTASIIFAITNVFVMCGMLKARLPSYWFSSYKYSNESGKATSTCDKIHLDSTCRNYLLKELAQTVYFAHGACNVKSFMSCIANYKKDVLTIFKIYFQTYDYKLFTFFVGIDGIFKFLFCYLNQNTTFKPVTNCAISAFAAGLSYALLPSYEFFTLGITTALSILYKILINSYAEDKKEMPKILKFINKLPGYNIMMLTFLPTLVHLRLLQPYYVNRRIDRFMNLITNGMDQQIIYRGISVLLGYGLK